MPDKEKPGFADFSNEKKERLIKGNCEIHGDVYLELNEENGSYNCARCNASQNGRGIDDKFPGRGLRSTI